MVKYDLDLLLLGQYSWLEYFPVRLDFKKIWYDLLLCCLLANMFHASFVLKFTFLFIRVFVLAVYVTVCVWQGEGGRNAFVVVENLCTLNISRG